MKRNHLSQGSLLLVIIMVLTAGLWALLPAVNAEACTPNVTVTKTTPDDGSAGTLRWAIANVCSSGTIDFNLTYPATITLTGGMLTIDRSLTIAGPGADKLTIDGDGVRVFWISPGTVYISGLTISDGSASDGGGIYNSGANLTVTDCTFSDNKATKNSGGGIANDNGNLTVTNCTFSGNEAYHGGGIWSGGTLSVINSTFSGNTASNGGGGIENDNALRVINSTFSGNSAPDKYGGGIENNSSAQLRNTIVANNTGGNCAGTIISQGHNLESGTDCGFTQTGDKQSADPKLDSLALNAPGTTETFALLAGSPAIDAADPGNFPDTDQRGVARPQGAGPDIGAYEYVFAVAPVPTMNNWGMVMFILLAGLGSVYYLRRRRRAEG